MRKKRTQKMPVIENFYTIGTKTGSTKLLFNFPIPGNDAAKFIRYFKDLKIDSKPLKSTFALDTDFFARVIEQDKTFVNFCFVENKGDLDIIIHFSEFRDSIGLTDAFFRLVPSSAGKNLLELKAIDLSTYINTKSGYKNGLGKKINNKTNQPNTEIVSYSSKDILLYAFINYSDVENRNPNTSIESLNFTIIRFKAILGSSLEQQYDKKLGKIGFLVNCTLKEIKGKRVINSETEYYDITDLIP